MNSSESVSLEGFEVFRDEIFTRAQVSSAKSKAKLENLVLEKWRTLSLPQRLKYAETAKTFTKRKLETDSSSLSPSKKLKLDATVKKEPVILDTIDESVPQNDVANETPVQEIAVVDNLDKAVEDGDRSVEYDEILSSGCHICKVKFKTVHNYPRHTKGKHSLVYISCKKCKMFYPQKSFKDHKCVKTNIPLQSSQNPGILQNISNQVNLALNKNEKNNSNKDKSQMKQHVETPSNEKSTTTNSMKEQVEKVWPDYIDAKSLKITGCPECKQIIKSGKYSLHLMEVHKVQYKFVMNSKDGKVDPKYVLINKPTADGVSVKTEQVEQRSDLLKIPPKLNPANIEITQPVQKSDLVGTQPRLNTTSAKTPEPVQPNLDLLKPKLNLSSVKTEPMEVEVISNEIVEAKIGEKDTTPMQSKRKSSVIKNINSRPKSKTSSQLESSLPNNEVKNNKNIQNKVNAEVIQEKETLNPKNNRNEDEQISIIQENLLIQEEQIRTVIFQTEALQPEAIPMENTESSEADPLCDNVDNLDNTKDGSDRRNVLEVESREDGNILNSNAEDSISRKIPALIDKLRSEIRQLLQEAKKKCLENPIVLSVDEDKDNIGTDSEKTHEDNSNDGEEETDVGLEELYGDSNVELDHQEDTEDAHIQEVEEDAQSQEVEEDAQSQEVEDSESQESQEVEDPESQASQEVEQDPQSQEVEEKSSNSLIVDVNNKDHEDIEPTLDMEVTSENDDQISTQSAFNNYKKVISGRSSFSTLQPSKLIFQKTVINFSTSSVNEDISKQENDLNSYKMIMSGKNTSMKKSNAESSASTDDEITSIIKEDEHMSDKIKEEKNNTSNKIKEENTLNKTNPSSVIKATERTEDNNNNTAAGKPKRRNPRINNNKNKPTKKPSEKQENLNQAVADVITYKLTPSEAVVKYKVTHSSLWMELVTNPADKQALARVGMTIEEERKVVAAWQDLVRGLTGMEMMDKCEDNTKEVMQYARFVCEEGGKVKVEVGEEWWLAFRKKHDLLWRKT